MAIKRGVYGDIGVGGYQTLEELARLLSKYIEDIFATTEFVMDNFEPKGLVMAHINTDDAHPQYRRLDTEVPITDLEGPEAVVPDWPSELQSTWWPNLTVTEWSEEHQGFIEKDSTGRFRQLYVYQQDEVDKIKGVTNQDLITVYVTNLHPTKDLNCTVSIGARETFPQESGGMNSVLVFQNALIPANTKTFKLSFPLTGYDNDPIDGNHEAVVHNVTFHKSADDTPVLVLEYVTIEEEEGTVFNRFIREDKSWAFVTKGDVGLGNVDNIQQATKFEFDTHNNDSDRHVTGEERESWNSKETPEGSQAKVDLHSDDNVRHITAAERLEWNSKETPAGAQTKVDIHADDKTIHVTQEDRDRWDASPRGTISPPIPAVYRRAGTAQNIPASSTTKITAWTGSGYDIFGMGDGSDFTVPSWASYARVTTEVRIQHIKSADAGHLWVAVYLDDAVMASGQTRGTDSISYPSAQATTGIIPVTAGQKFNIRAWHNADTDKTLFLGGACFINIELFEDI